MSKELRRMLLASAAVQMLGVFTESGVITGIGIALLLVAVRVWWVKDSATA